MEIKVREKLYHRRAILMGVVRQEVKRSAGRSGFMGSSSLASQAASWMQFFIEGGSGIWASGWPGLMAATWIHTTAQGSLTFTSHRKDHRRQVYKQKRDHTGNLRVIPKPLNCWHLTGSLRKWMKEVQKEMRSCVTEDKTWKRWQTTQRRVEHPSVTA